MEPQLKFVGSNPGAVRHGNFINYYEFHPALERITNLPREIWSLKTGDNNLCVALDIGCNSGELTVELLNFLEDNLKDENDRHVKVHMVGIDLDPALINRAQEKFTPGRSNVAFHAMDGTKEDSLCQLQNILGKLNATEFDVVFLMSVTMWVHLVNGDEAFHSFLKKCAGLTSKWLVIESQPWKCYRSAQRRLVSSGDAGFAHYPKLAIKGDKLGPFVDNVLCSECDMDKIFESEPSKWNRKICIYQKR